MTIIFVFITRAPKDKYPIMPRATLLRFN